MSDRRDIETATLDLWIMGATDRAVLLSRQQRIAAAWIPRAHIAGDIPPPPYPIRTKLTLPEWLVRERRLIGTEQTETLL